MNKFGKASRPLTWPAPGRPKEACTPMASPAPSRGPCPIQPLIPSTGCRGKGLLSIPRAAGRPVMASMKGKPRSCSQDQESVQSHVESLKISVRPRPGLSTRPFTVPSLPPAAPASQVMVSSSSSGASSAMASSSKASQSRPKRKEAPPLYNLTRGANVKHWTWLLVIARWSWQ